MGHQAKPMHGHEHAIDSGECEPEMKFAKRFVQPAPEHLGKPEKQCAKDCEGSSDAHHQMEMAGDEIVADGSGGEIVAREKNPRNSAGKKKRNESEREQHRGIQLDLRVPKRAEPTEQQDKAGNPSEDANSEKTSGENGLMPLENMCWPQTQKPKSPRHTTARTAARSVQTGLRENVESRCETIPKHGSMAT